MEKIGTEGATLSRGETRVSMREAGEIDSRDLFGEARTVLIRHGGDVYTLRITRSDKLILTK